ACYKYLRDEGPLSPAREGGDGVEVRRRDRECSRWGQGTLGLDFPGRQVPGEHPSEPGRISVPPLWWRMTHNSRWVARVLASELSLVAFILLLAMVFSKKWLCLSGSRVYQRWPSNVSSRIYTSARLMSMGLLHICKSKSCSSSENGKVTFIFSTLLLFPINLWIFELKRNLSVPIGWSYFIGWLVFVLYVTCAALCHFNHKHFWSVIVNCPSRAASCSNGSSSVQNFPSEPGGLTHLGQAGGSPGSGAREGLSVTFSEILAPTSAAPRPNPSPHPFSKPWVGWLSSPRGLREGGF
uniref:Outer dense fiber of sperm tails 4 n=1 Tax=Panthera leo TaxID=9689 RepID=A0A8C8XJG9_PANLE